MATMIENPTHLTVILRNIGLLINVGSEEYQRITIELTVEQICQLRDERRPGMDVSALFFEILADKESE